MASDTWAPWLDGGQFHCDAHRQGIPFFDAPADAVCAECTNDDPKSYLTPRCCCSHGCKRPARGGDPLCRTCAENINCDIE